MKRDIRELFQEEDYVNKLPENHRIEFERKLEGIKKSKKKIKVFAIIACIAVLVVSYIFLNQESEVIVEPSILQQVQQIEKEYQKNIEKEWSNFLELTSDQQLISRYRIKLENLSNKYLELSKKLNNQPNNITVLEQLIFNLQTRLQTIRDIQEHIKSLNQKNKTYETIII